MVAKDISILRGGLNAAKTRRSKSEMMLPRIACPMACLEDIFIGRRMFLDRQGQEVSTAVQSTSTTLNSLRFNILNQT
jgi:hypothetical protein